MHISLIKRRKGMVIEDIEGRVSQFLVVCENLLWTAINQLFSRLHLQTRLYLLTFIRLSRF